MKSPLYFWSRAIFIVVTFLMLYFSKMLYIFYLALTDWLWIEEGFYYFVFIIVIVLLFLIYKIYIKSKQEFIYRNESDNNLSFIDKIFGVGFTMFVYWSVFFLLIYSYVGFWAFIVATSCPATEYLCELRQEAKISIISWSVY